MEATLHALGQILVQALPTFVLVLLLFVYLRSVFFKPLERVLAERDEATEGARQKAAAALDRAQAKVAAYEEQMRAARNEIYREQEEVRLKWRDDQTAQIAAARQRTEALVKEAKATVAAEAERGQGRSGREQPGSRRSDNAGHSAKENRLKYVVGIALIATSLAFSQAHEPSPRSAGRACPSPRRSPFRRRSADAERDLVEVGKLRCSRGRFRLSDRKERRSVLPLAFRGDPEGHPAMPRRFGPKPKRALPQSRSGWLTLPGKSKNCALKSREEMPPKEPVSRAETRGPD